MRHLLLAVAVVLTVSACEKSQPPAERRPDPVAVYVAGGDSETWSAEFDRFTADTGIRVTVKSGEPDLIVKAVVENNGSPPADVLLAGDVARIWVAAEEGGLRALRSEAIDAAVAPRLRDPDSLWFGISYRSAEIVYNRSEIDLSGIGDYANLSDADLRGKLCLSSSSLPVNRALIAMLIADIGVRPAEVIVRGWKRNLAALVFESEDDLLTAINDGRCGGGIASSDAVAAYTMRNPEHQLGVARPAVAHANVEAVGVARHARNPEGGKVLVEWLVAQSPLLPEQLVGISTRNIGFAGWHDEAAIKLAERASYP